MEMEIYMRYLKTAIQSLTAGALSALVVNAAWLLVTGGLPSLQTALITGQMVTTLWALVQAARFQKKWQGVLASYARPAFGEGIDTPHRPPAEPEDA
ncbi:hypothetical protein [Streptomyces sp. AcH 505]|uniref:hypothetical protein n=1 Tax=Streptomyces sp. AcH 505 TaxID=352211 RepID=UPI0012FEF551